MRKSILINGFSFVLLFLLLCSPALAHSLNITDYDTTVSGASETRLSCSYNYNCSYDDSHIMDSTNKSGNLGLEYHNFYDSLNYSWGLNAALNYNASTIREPWLNSDHFTNAHDLSCNYNYYFLPENSIYHGFAADYQILNNNNGNSTGNEYYSTTLSYNLGIGHVIDITPLAEAGVLEDRLKEDGIIKKSFSKDEMLKMARIIRKFRMSEYNYDSPDTASGNFLKDLIAIVESSGKATRPLGGFAFWRISDNRAVNYLRYKGWKLELSFSNIYSTSIVSNTDSNMDISRDLYASLSYTAYIPIDWKSQLKINIMTSAPFEPRDTFPVSKNHADIYYSYDLTNKIWCSLSLFIDRNNYESGIASDSSSSRGYSSGINYKIEDKFILSINYNRQFYDTWNSNEHIDLTGNYYF